MMQAIVQNRYGSADVLKLEEIDRPRVGDDEVLVRVHAAGVHQGDWHFMTGLPYLARLGIGLRKPKSKIRGMDLAGTVEAVGKDVTLRPGDDVFGWCHGTFAEYVRAPQTHFLPKPSRLTFEQAAAVPISGIAALQGLRDAGKIRAGQKVVVIGAAGGVGSFAVQIAKALGAHVTGVCSTAKVELVRSLGADHVIDYTRDDFTRSPERYDLILDTAGRRPLRQLRRALTPTGTLVLVGGEGGDRWLGGFQRHIWAAILSPFVRHQLRMLYSVERTEDLAGLKELIDAGKVTPVIDRTYPLREAPHAMRYIAQGHAAGKTVITV
jgi:NADPH:quinone reductase-like Zn-dependent oxidoreductase